MQTHYCIHGSTTGVSTNCWVANPIQKFATSLCVHSSANASSCPCTSSFKSENNSGGQESSCWPCALTLLIHCRLLMPNLLPHLLTNDGRKLGPWNRSPHPCMNASKEQLASRGTHNERMIIYALREKHEGSPCVDRCPSIFVPRHVPKAHARTEQVPVECSPRLPTSLNASREQHG